MPDVGPEEGVPLSGRPDALVCLVEDHGVGAHLLQHAHRLNRVLPLRPAQVTGEMPRKKGK